MVFVNTFHSNRVALIGKIKEKIPLGPSKKPVLVTFHRILFRKYTSIPLVTVTRRSKMF